MLVTLVFGSSYSLLMITVHVCIQVSVTTTVTHQGSGCRGEMIVSMPVDGYRLSKWSWNHEHSANKWKCHHELHVRSRQFVVDIDANHRVTRAVRRLSANFTFQTPANVASWLQNLNAVVDYQHDMHAWKSSGRTNFQWGQYAFGHEHDVNIEPYTAFITTAKLSTPFSGFEQLGVGLNNRRSGNSWTANNEILMGHIGNATLDASLNYNGYNFESMIRIITPIRHVERIAVNVRNAQQSDDVWASHADIQYTFDKTVSIDSKISLGSQRMIELEATTPFSFLREMTYKAGCSGTWRSFRASTELQHNMLGREKIRAVMSVNANNLYRVNGQLIIRTPFEKFSSLRVTLRHIQDSHEHVTTTVSWQLNQFRGSLSQDVTASSWTDFDTRHEIEYLNNRKIELTSSLHLNPKIVATATLKSPCEHARLISFNFTQEGPLDNCKMIAELLLNNYKSTEILEFSLHQKTMTLNGNIQTPFSYLRSLTYTINHNGDWRNFRNNFTMAYNGRQISGNSEFVVDRGSIKFELHTPWRALRSYNFQHANKPGHSFVGWRNSWSIESDGQTKSGRSEVDWDGNRLDAHVLWNLPEEYSIRISHAGSFENELSSQLRAQLPFEAVRRLAVSLNHRGDPADFSSNLTASVNDKTVTSTLTFMNSPRTTEGSLNLHTPFNGYDRFQVMFAFNGEPQHFTASSTVRLPFDGYEHFYAGIEHEHLDSLKTAISVRTPIRGYENYSLSLLKAGDASNLQLKAEMTSSVRHLEHTAVSWSHSVAQRSLTTNLLVETSIPGYSKFATLSEYSSSRRIWKWNGSVETPIRGYERWTAGIEHAKGDSNNGFRTVVQMTSPVNNYLNFAAVLSHFEQASQLRTQLRVNLPFREVPQIDVTFRHRGVSPRDFATSLSVEYAGKKIEVAMTFLMGVVRQTRINYEGSFRLVAPCRYVRDFSITVSHNCKPENNTGALKVIFNGDEKVSVVLLAAAIYILTVRGRILVK